MLRNRLYVVRNEKYALSSFHNTQRPRSYHFRKNWLTLENLFVFLQRETKRKQQTMKKKVIEDMRRMTEQECRKKSETIIVVTLMNDAEQDAVVDEYRERGYELKNVALFGEAGINVGKFLIFDVAFE